MFVRCRWMKRAAPEGQIDRVSRRGMGGPGNGGGCGWRFDIRVKTPMDVVLAEKDHLAESKRPSPDDFSESDCPLEQSKCTMAPRSIVVLLRSGGGKNERAI